MTIREQLEAAKTSEYLTVRQVALLTQYNEQTVYRKAWRNEIPGVVRFGRSMRFVRVQIMPWTLANREKRDLRPLE